MSDRLINDILDIGGHEIGVTGGAYLFHQGDPVASLFIVTDGLVELVRYQEDGNSIVLQRAATRSVLAEASVYSKRYHCAAIAKLPATLVEISRQLFLAKLQEDRGFSDSWTAHLAREMQSARYRSEILSRRTVAERLDGWLAWKDSGLPEKGQWKSVAEQIAVSPEALYRELARRQK